MPEAFDEGINPCFGHGELYDGGQVYSVAIDDIFILKRLMPPQMPALNVFAGWLACRRDESRIISRGESMSDRHHRAWQEEIRWYEDELAYFPAANDVDRGGHSTAMSKPPTPFPYGRVLPVPRCHVRGRD